MATEYSPGQDSEPSSILEILMLPTSGEKEHEEHAREYMIVYSDVLIERASQTEILCLMPKHLDMLSTFIRVYLVHHDCITALTKPLSKKSQFHHDDFNEVTSMQSFPLEKSRTLQIYPHIYPLWGIAFACFFDYSYT
jgi:hypothetical protein